MGDRIAGMAAEGNGMNRRICGVFFILFFSFYFYSGPKAFAAVISDDDGWKAFRQDKLEKEGDALLRQGLYDEAYEKFKQADAPELKMKGFQDSMAKMLMRQACYLKGEYGKALALLTPLVEMNLTQWNWQDERRELEAVIASRDTESREPLRGYIAYAKEKHKDEMPPRKYIVGITEGIDAAIIRCYDQMGDYDGGISYVDGILNYFKERDLKKYGKLKWGKADGAYLQVKLAFEQDKKEGKTGCMGKPGCVGRATKALVQSDYFPW